MEDNMIVTAWDKTTWAIVVLSTIDGTVIVGVAGVMIVVAGFEDGILSLDVLVTNSSVSNVFSF
jgi:hypothetical protein